MEESLSGLERVLPRARDARACAARAVISVVVRLPLRGPRRARAGVRDRRSGWSPPARRRSASATRPGWPTRAQVREFFAAARRRLGPSSSSPPTSTTPAARGWPTSTRRSRPGSTRSSRASASSAAARSRPGATGNVATEDVVSMLHEIGVRDRHRPAGADRLHARAAAPPGPRRWAATRWSAGPVDWHALMFDTRADRQPGRDRPPGDPHPGPARDRLGRRLHARRPPTPRTCARPTRRCRSPPTSTSRRSIARLRRGPARRRCTPATASCPRTRRWPGRARPPGVAFVGPPPEASELMGDKLARQGGGASRPGVPVVPELHRRGRPRTRRRVPAAGQGRRRRRRARDAGRRARRPSSTPRWPRPGARRRPGSATTACSSSASCPGRATSRSR